jgi:hypothetical protein
MLRLASLPLSLGVALVALAPTAIAQPATDGAEDRAGATPSDVERARDLFAEGVQLVDQSRWAEAEGRFREALELRPSPVIAYNLASTLEAQGEYVEASGLLHGVLAQADLPEQLRTASAAKLAAILPRIAHLTITLSGASANATVALDGRPLSAGERSAAEPIDPGRHEVVAEGAGGGVARAAVAASEGESTTIELVLPVSTPAEAAAMAAADAPTPSDADVARRRRRWIWPVVAGAVVIAAIVATSVAVTRDRTEAPVEGTFPPGVITVQVGP